MTRYIGLDAHSESCTIAVLGGSGKRLRHERLQTSAELLKSFIKEVPRPRHLCMEEGTLSEWLCEELAPVVDKLVVVMPDRNPGNKSDLIDAASSPTTYGAMQSFGQSTRHRRASVRCAKRRGRTTFCNVSQIGL